MAFGCNDLGQAKVPSEVSAARAVAVAAGDGHSVVLLASGRVIPFGDPALLTDPQTMSGLESVDSAVRIVSSGPATATVLARGALTSWARGLRVNGAPLRALALPAGMGAAAVGLNNETVMAVLRPADQLPSAPLLPLGMAPRDDDGGSGTSLAIIVGAVAGGCALVLLVVAAMTVICIRKRRRRMRATSPGGVSGKSLLPHSATGGGGMSGQFNALCPPSILLPGLSPGVSEYERLAPTVH
jgi:hypothetical protein